LADRKRRTRHGRENLESDATFANLLPNLLISLGATAVLTAFEAVVITVTCYKLRGAKEGTAIAEIAKLFD
jgi:hypothetical protein